MACVMDTTASSNTVDLDTGALRMDPCVIKMEKYPREALRLLSKYISPKIASSTTNDLRHRIAEVIYSPTTDELWYIFSDEGLAVGYWVSGTTEGASYDSILSRNIFSVTGSGVGMSIQTTLEGDTTLVSFKRYPEKSMTREDFSGVFVDYVTLAAAILRRPRVRNLARLYPDALSNALNAEILAQLDVEYEENLESRDELYAWSLVNLICLGSADADVLVERPEIDIDTMRSQIRELLVSRITKAVYSVQ